MGRGLGTYTTILGDWTHACLEGGCPQPGEQLGEKAKVLHLRWDRETEKHTGNR